MNSIKVLNKNLSNMIAAGEVVERPANVVKELVENSLDSGADAITVEIKNGGKTYIRVTDNGHGMTKEDAPRAFLRHATSKISTESDLFNIKTMGFRGEALAAISSVSKVELMTAVSSDSYGTRVVVEAGEELCCEDIGVPAGTTLIVKDLFFNTPARMNFLKKDSTETANIISIINKLAIGNTDVSFRLIVDGKTVLSTDRNSKFIDILYTVFGKEISDNLLPVEKTGDKIAVSGFVGQPKCSRSNRNYQLFYVNGRIVKSKTVNAAIDRAYHNLLMNGKYAVAVLMLSLPFDKIDVNVHPTKMEVKFSDEGKVFDTVYYAVKDALSNENQVNQNVSDYFKTFSSDDALLANDDNNLNSGYIQATFGGDSFSFKRMQDTEEQPMPICPLPVSNDFAVNNTLKNYGYTVENSDVQMHEEPNSIQTYSFEDDDDPYFLSNQIPYKYIGEVFKTYIIVESGSSFYLIDKHAAHERILFDKIYDQYKTSEKYCQELLTGIRVELSPEEADLANRNKEKLVALGYYFDDFGDTDVILRTAPNVIPSMDIKSAFMEMLVILAQDRNADMTELETKNIKMLACKAAIKAGFNNTDVELQNFIRELLIKGDVNYCPHGRPIICEYTKESVEKAFKRIV